MAKSTFLGLFGLGLTAIGVNLIFASLALGLVLSIIALTGINILTASQTPLVIGLFGAFFSVYGLKLFFENETGFLKLLLGLFGILLMLSGIATAIAGLPTGAIPLFGLLIMFSMGTAFVSYGFDVKILKPFKSLTVALKQTVDVLPLPTGKK